MKLLSVLKNKPFCNNIHYVVVSIILVSISFKYPIFYLFLGFYLIFLLKKKSILILSIIISLIVFIHLFLINKIYTKLDDGIYSGIVYDVDDNYYILLTTKGKIRITSYDNDIKPGERLTLDITFIEISDKSYLEDFSYKDYLYSKGIYYTAKENKIIKRSNGFFITSIKYYLLEFYKSKLSSESFEYVSALVFAKNDFSNSITDAYSMLGISHILAVSGMHILFLYSIISFILLHLFHYYKSTIPLIIITIYTIIIGLPPSCLRALLFLILGVINKKGNIHYTKLDIFSISFLFMVIINPYQIYQLGFILSYLVSFILIFTNDLLKTKSKLLSSYESYVLIYFLTLPFITTINNKITLLSFIYSPILSIVLGVFLLPIAYLITICPIFDNFLKYIFIFLNQYVMTLSRISPSIHIKTFNIYERLIYYSIFILLLICRLKNKYKLPIISIFILYFTIYLNLNLFNPFNVITYIDVGQGDSSLIRLKHDSGVIVVDCYNSFDYLKSTGISKIDLLILTHSDNDHMKDYKEVIDYFDVKRILYSKYDYVMEDLLKEYDNTYPISDGITYKVGDSEIWFLGPINYYDELNSISIVFNIKIDDLTFFYAADMTIKEEIDIINKYKDKLNSDFLKVAHHGSNTSTSEEILKLITPKYAIVSVLDNNKYNLPNDEVIERLKYYSEVYETRYTGNINIKVLYNKYYIQKYK